MMERMTTASATAILVNEEGLHVRPAAEFVALANSFESAITANGANGKGVLSLMALGLPVGSAVTVAAEGPDAEAAVAALTALIEAGFPDR